MSLIVSNGLGNTGGVYPPCLAFLITSVVGDVLKITVNLTNTPIISGPGADPTAYTLTSNTGRAVTVTGVVILGDALVLTTTTQTDSATYVLHMPVVGIIDVDANPFEGPFTNSFLGVGLPLQVLLAYSVDVITLDIIFNQPVNDASALDTANYSITPTLSVVGSRKITESVYRLTTSPQTSGQVYTVNTTGILPL